MLQDAVVHTISRSAKLIEGSGRATIMLPCGTKVDINKTLYSPKSQRNLLSFKDMRRNGYHIETMCEGNVEYLNITKISSGKKYVLEKLPELPSSLYYTSLKENESYMVVEQKFTNHRNFIIWHDRLGHPGSVMMQKIINSSCGHKLKNEKILQSNDFPCITCSQGKLIVHPSLTKIGHQYLAFLERIQGDICEPIHPPSGPFRYFMILIDASTRWSHISLLSTRNVAFARMLAQIIKLRAQFPDNPIKTIRLDNIGEFTSNSFNEYCMSTRISVEHPVAQVHTQNGLAESFIKRLRLIARPLLMKSTLPMFVWGHAILHAAALVRIRPTSTIVLPLYSWFLAKSQIFLI
jgi:hypothetical protein